MTKILDIKILHVDIMYDTITIRVLANDDSYKESSANKIGIFRITFYSTDGEVFHIGGDRGSLDDVSLYDFYKTAAKEALQKEKQHAII